jgi:lipase chaperone LimK
MRTLTIYKFNELSDEAKAKAIEAVREDLKEEGHNQFA